MQKKENITVLAKHFVDDFLERYDTQTCSGLKSRNKVAPQDIDIQLFEEYVNKKGREAGEISHFSFATFVFWNFSFMTSPIRSRFTFNT